MTEKDVRADNVTEAESANVGSASVTADRDLTAEVVERMVIGGGETHSFLYCPDLKIGLNVDRETAVRGILSVAREAVRVETEDLHRRLVLAHESAQREILRAEAAEAEAARLNANIIERAAQLIAHRVCIATEHNPAHGKLHGCCVTCGETWPCDTASAALGPQNGGEK